MFRTASTTQRFSSRADHRHWLASMAQLPTGFRCGSHRFDFVPQEVHKPAKMTMTLVTLDQPTSSFAALYTRNALPGAPVLIGRRRLAEPTIGAVLINNKISNVCAPGGVEASESLCAAVGAQLGLTANQVVPCSTGVIGWRLPVEAMTAALPQVVSTLQPTSALVAAEGIVTTDLFPKMRRRDLGGGSIVGIAKGAGMMEPNLATMLVFILTDLAVPREELRTALRNACDRSFNCMSVDSDTSTSDTVLALSSQLKPCPEIGTFTRALTELCCELAEDIARNGEGVHHVLRVQVVGAPDDTVARAVGKSVVNSPLLQCAVCGNDPNVGRLVMAIGKEVGARGLTIDPQRLRLTMGGQEIFKNGCFVLDPQVEAALVEHLGNAELYRSIVPADGVFVPPVDYPPHDRRVEIGIDLGLGAGSATIIGTDRSHEYISENADYRS